MEEKFFLSGFLLDMVRKSHYVAGCSSVCISTWGLELWLPDLECRRGVFPAPTFHMSGLFAFQKLM